LPEGRGIVFTKPVIISDSFSHPRNEQKKQELPCARSKDYNLGQRRIVLESSSKLVFPPWSRVHPMATTAEQRTKRVFEFGPFRVDPDRELLLRGDETVPLTPKTFQILSSWYVTAKRSSPKTT
jgi:DNA-binding winged helix-turn-helix (wHTH) protein